MSYRLPMIRYRQQGFDVYSDSRHYEYYLAIECKSIVAEDVDVLYFSRYFHHVKGVHQLDHEDRIIQMSGRVGFLAVELKRRNGVRKSAFLVPWKIVMKHYEEGDVGIEADEILNCIELYRSKGGYHLTPSIIEEYLHHVCGKPTVIKCNRVEVRDWYSRRH